MGCISSVKLNDNIYIIKYIKKYNELNKIKNLSNIGELIIKNINFKWNYIFIVNMNYILHEELMYDSYVNIKGFFDIITNFYRKYTIKIKNLSFFYDDIIDKSNIYIKKIDNYDEFLFIETLLSFIKINFNKISGLIITKFIYKDNINEHISLFIYNNCDFMDMIDKILQLHTNEIFY
jgi:hypothetical protein